MKCDADVIVLGAGLAGLGAATALGAAGKSVLVLEARDRVGGRVHTVRDAATAYPMELGPEWVGASGALRELLDSLQADVRTTQGFHFVRYDEGLLARDNFDESMEIMERVSALLNDGDDLTLDAALEQCCPEEEFEEARAALRGYVQGFHAADASKVSVRWLLAVEENEPANASEGHALAGLDRAVDALRIRLPRNVVIHLQTVATDVVWSEAGVDVGAVQHGETVTFSAKALVCALPLGVLKVPPGAVSAVRFTPPLDSKRRALGLLEMGAVSKVQLVFDEPFWTRLSALEQASFLLQPGLPFPTWWTTYPVDAPVLTGWVAGPPVAGLGELRGDSLLALAINSAASVLGVSREQVTARLRGWHTYDWGADPYARGGYSYVLSGGADAPEELALPIENTLFFAGEATCGEGHNATMEGALQSGQRAAHEVLASIK